MHQVRNFSAPHTAESFWTHYAKSETTVCLFGKLTTVAYWGNAAVGFTSNTRDIFLPAHNLTFYSAPGVNPSVVEMVSGTGTANVENVLQFSSSAITEEDLEAGKWNFAHLEMWLMNWADLGIGEFVVYSGYLGEISNMQTFFKAEADGGHSLLQNNYGDVTSRICRIAEVGKGQCKLDLNGTTSDGFSIKKNLTVASIADKYHFSLSRVENVPNDFYNHGKITALSGANAGIAREIKTGTGFGTSTVNIALRRPFPFPVAAGQQFELIVGDDKTLERCVYLGQGINRDAEDFIPNLENSNRFPPAT